MSIYRKLSYSVVAVIAAVFFLGAAHVSAQEVQWNEAEFSTHTYAADSFSGAEKVACYHEFGLTARDFVKLNYSQTGGGVEFQFCMEKQSVWYNTVSGFAELRIEDQLNLKGKTVHGITVRDTVFGGLVIVETPTKTHEVSLGNFYSSARGTMFTDELLVFRQAGQYKITVLFASWYRVDFGAKQFEYHAFEYSFTVTGSGTNAIDSVWMYFDEVLRFESRSGKIEIQMRSDDYYYWTNCQIIEVRYERSNILGEKFYTVTYLYAGAEISELVREEFLPNHEIIYS